jgi:hypothetical protein
MIGGIEETSASFEARSAPRSYPTDSDIAGKARRALTGPAVSSSKCYNFGLRKKNPAPAKALARQEREKTTNP